MVVHLVLVALQIILRSMWSSWQVALSIVLWILVAWGHLVNDLNIVQVVNVEGMIGRLVLRWLGNHAHVVGSLRSCGIWSSSWSLVPLDRAWLHLLVVHEVGWLLHHCGLNFVFLE